MASETLAPEEIRTLAEDFLEFAHIYLSTAKRSRPGFRKSLLNEMKNIQRTMEADDKVHKQNQIAVIKAS